MNELSVDELIELTTEAAPEVFTRLSEIKATATAEGITATVNLEGRLIALTVEPEALTRGPAKLAAEIYGLVQDASATALNQGIETLTPTAGEELAKELRALVLPEPAKPPKPHRREAPQEEDYSTVETWAVKH